MTSADNNLQEQKDLDELEETPADKAELSSGKADFDPKKLNLTLVFAGILAVLLMWYLSSKLF